MQRVDLALCLAMDVSASVDFDEFGLMAGGTAAALRAPDIVAAATSGPAGAIAVALLLWSARGSRTWPCPGRGSTGRKPPRRSPMPWTTRPRLPAPGATAIGEGMAAALACSEPCRRRRRATSSTSRATGGHNLGRAPGPVRDLAVAAGITVNGLAILNEEPDLLAHYQAEVIGGPGSFAMDCPDYDAFAEAIRRKLWREIRGGLVA
jgi:hypothetical protein